MDLPSQFWNQLTFLGDKERDALAASYGEEPPVSFRLNRSKLTATNHERVPWNDHGYYLESRPSFTADPLFHAGGYYVQEASSMVIGTIVRDLLTRIGEHAAILDLCGAPGGKSTDIANQLRAGDILLSNEVINSRVQVLKENVIKWGSPNHHVCSNDPADFQRLPGFFDVVVVDAPCSGEGLFRKDRKAVEQWSPEAVTFCQQRQLRIVEDVWDTLKEGGYLIYSTCTLNKTENEEVLREIASRFDVSSYDFKADETWHFRQFDVDGFCQFKILPHRTKGEGFSFFIVRKEESTGHMKYKKNKRERKSSQKVVVEELEELATSIHVEEDRVLTYDHEEKVDMLHSQLRMVKRGTMLGTLKKGKLIPSHEWAMAAQLDKKGHPVIELAYEDAITYLQRGAPVVPAIKRGFALVAYRGIPLGWINHLGNRSNNLYPPEYRILTQTRQFHEPHIV